MRENSWVLSQEDSMAGPYASSLLGDLGCEVIKIELPNGGDSHRGRNPKYEGYGPTLASIVTKSVMLICA